MKYFASRHTSIKCKHEHTHTHAYTHRNTHCKRGGEKRLASRQLAEGQPAKRVGERERKTDRDRQREREGGREEKQEGPYIAYRKSCVRAGNSMFGHGGFLAS